MCLHDNVDLCVFVQFVYMSVLEQNNLYHGEKKTCMHLLIAEMYDDDDEDNNNEDEAVAQCWR